MIKFYKCTYNQYMNIVLVKERVQNFFTLNYNASWTADQFTNRFLQLNQNQNADRDLVKNTFIELINKRGY